MGRGDKRTKKGKRYISSNGVSRLRKSYQMTAADKIRGTK